MLSAVGRLHWLANVFGTRLDDIHMTLAHIPSHTSKPMETAQSATMFQCSVLYG